MDNSPEDAPKPNKPKEGIKDFVSRLEKKLEEGDKFTLSGLASDEGLDYERLLRAQQLLGFALRFDLPFTAETWREFAKLVLDDKKMSAILGDMKRYIDNGPCPHDHGPEEAE